MDKWNLNIYKVSIKKSRSDNKSQQDKGNGEHRHKSKCMSGNKP